MCNFVLVGEYEMCDLSPIVFVGNIKYIVTVYLCVLGIKTKLSNILQHMYVMSVVSVTLKKKGPSHYDEWRRSVFH